MYGSAVNGDMKTMNVTGGTYHTCETACEADVDCEAWTFTPPQLCRLKALASKCILVVSQDNCFLPNYGHIDAAQSNATSKDPVSSTSGMKRSGGGGGGGSSISGVQYAVLYAYREHTSLYNASCGRVPNDCDYGHSPMATILRLRASESSVHLHVFVDKSIIEAFGQGGRAVLTTRVYPTLDASDAVYAYGQSSASAPGAVMTSFNAWAMKGSHMDPSELNANTVTAINTTGNTATTRTPTSTPTPVTTTTDALEPKANIATLPSRTAATASSSAYVDTRNIQNGVVMLKEGYTDQPYCATNGVTGDWSCVITARIEQGEGGYGERVTSVVSTDKGATWEGPFTVEQGLPDGLPNAYANIVLAPGLGPKKQGRLYAIYNLK
jgi:hypothetical protein